MARPMPGVPLIPTGDGRYVSVQDDGSTVIYDGTMNVVGGDPSPNPMRAAAVRSGDNDAAIDAAKDAISRENTRRWNTTSDQAGRQIDLRADEIENAYRVNMMQAQTSQDQQRATAQYQQDQTQLARDRLAWDREYGQARLGYDVLNMGAQLRGPSDYFQAAEFSRGVSQMPGTSTFLSALQNNTRLGDFGAQGGQPAPETIGTLTAKLSGQGGNPNTGNYLAQIGNVGAKGAHQLGAGSLENLTDTERKLFTSGLEELGYDSNTFLDQYRRSRIGQNVGRAGYA